MELFKRKSVFTELADFVPMNQKGDFIEITEWTNGDGFDVNVCTKYGPNSFFQMSYDQYDAMKKLVKQLDKVEKFKKIKDN